MSPPPTFPADISRFAKFLPSLFVSGIESNASKNKLHDGENFVYFVACSSIRVQKFAHSRFTPQD